MNSDVQAYNEALLGEDKLICEQLKKIIDKNLAEAENKVWHGHPVWFINGNPIVGYAKLKSSVQLLFWSGQSFSEEKLTPEGSFEAAEKRYTSLSQIDEVELARWLKKAREIQWDYKNIVKRQGKLVRIGEQS